MNKRKSGLILLLISFAGLCLLLYPKLSDLWNRKTNSRAIATYTETISHLDDDKYVEIWAAAKQYNEELKQLAGYKLSDEMLERYNSVLNVTNDGIMGYVEIPRIDVSLPIYHGTDEAVLQIATGHIEWTNLPIGGSGTHCAICGHRGLPSATLFNDLPKLVLGDTFLIRVLDETLTYQVDQILTVKPNELDTLEAEEGRDYFTLMTCTPYGINSHRLLVRGHRIANSEEAKTVYVASEATVIEPLLVAPVIALAALIPILIGYILKGRFGKNKK